MNDLSSDPFAYYNPEVNPKQRLRFIASRWAGPSIAPSHLLAIEDVAFLYPKADPFISLQKIALVTTEGVIVVKVEVQVAPPL
ncbi:MAG TPA: hypothetical protein DCP08_06915 [Chloroflexi bacterium]|nr:hypothetical protein [Chloroflexota bacterium]